MRDGRTVVHCWQDHRSPKPRLALLVNVFAQCNSVKKEAPASWCMMKAVENTRRGNVNVACSESVAEKNAKIKSASCYIQTWTL